MPFLTSFILFLVSTAIQALIAPKQQNQSPQAGNLEVPVVDEGETMPIIFGTVMQKAPMIVWFGDKKTTKIKVKSGKK